MKATRKYKPRVRTSKSAKGYSGVARRISKKNLSRYFDELAIKYVTKTMAPLKLPEDVQKKAIRSLYERYGKNKRTGIAQLKRGTAEGMNVKGRTIENRLAGVKKIAEVGQGPDDEQELEYLRSRKEISTIVKVTLREPSEAYKTAEGRLKIDKFNKARSQAKRNPSADNMAAFNEAESDLKSFNNELKARILRNEQIEFDLFNKLAQFLK